MELIDTHAHLDSKRFGNDLAAVLCRARERGVERIVAVGVGLEASLKSLELARTHEGVHAAAGIHPHGAQGATSSELAGIQRLAADERVVAVGETGLDYVKEHSPRASQRELFAWHVDLARRVRKPLIVHNRGADEDCRSFLGGLGDDVTVILHCFSSDLDMINWALQRNSFISVAGQVTYPKAQALREVIAQVPEDRLLLETDCPFLVPQPRRSRVPYNEPAFIEYTARAVAELRRVSVEELAAATTENARRAFSLPAERLGASCHAGN